MWTMLSWNLRKRIQLIRMAVRWGLQELALMMEGMSLETSVWHKQHLLTEEKEFWPLCRTQNDPRCLLAGSRMGKRKSGAVCCHCSDCSIRLGAGYRYRDGGLTTSGTHIWPCYLPQKLDRVLLDIYDPPCFGKHSPIPRKTSRVTMIYRLDW